MNFFYAVSVLRGMPASLKKIILIFTDLIVLHLGSLIAVNSFIESAAERLDFFAAPIIGVAVLWGLGVYNSTSSESSINWLMPRVSSTAILTCFLSFMTHPGDPDAVIILNYLMVVIPPILVTRTISSQLKEHGSRGKPIAIYGAGEAGLRISDALKRSDKYRLVTFVDDDPALHGVLIGESRVTSFEQLSLLVSAGEIEELIVAIPSMKAEARSALMDRLKEFSIPISRCPSLSELLGGADFTNLKFINFDEFLGRSVVAPVYALLAASVSGKVVLVTGAGGSIGSELCRKICSQQPTSLILLDHSEHALYEVARALKTDYPEVNITPKLMSVLDKFNLGRLFMELSPNVVFHAAAYKHVPLFEDNVRVGLRNNVFGTLNLVDICESYSIEKFVLVSTDKAVRPTNLMGASKRVCELIVQARAAKKSVGTVFCMVRFGNVLGSSGSVIPLFQEQINIGGPVTVTSPEVTRFFMSISEAAELVLQASSLAEGGDVFVLDMGEPVKIVELARKMIEKQNMGDEIQIQFTGLRPGEKLYEELLVDASAERTSHKKIMKAHEPFIESEALNDKLLKLAACIDDEDLDTVILGMQDIVPGYMARSNV